MRAATVRTRAPRLSPWAGFAGRPTLVHADWSGTNPAKRWYCVARFREDHYHLGAPRTIETEPETWITEQLESPSIVLGFDFVIGLPEAFPRCDDFRAFLDQAPPTFFQKTSDLELVSSERPFFCGKGTKAEVTSRITKSTQSDGAALLRACERPRAYRGAAESLFWCKFAKQVGPASIHGWQHILRPAVAKGVALWPFDGADLRELVRERRQVILETYPGGAYSVLGLVGNRKTAHAWRRAACGRIEDVLSSHAIALDADLQQLFATGFGSAPTGGDPFDAVVGAILLALVALGERAPGISDVPSIQRKEGWILGCD